MMIPQRFLAKTAAAAAAALLAVLGTGLGTGLEAAQDAPKRPKLSLRATPPMAFTPATITLVAELRDGDDDYAEYYCASVEWDWADGTRSESSDDCDPYEAGKSEIRRRFTIQHKYNIEGNYDVQFRLKQRNKVVASARTRVTVRPGR
ncbi:MAG TPA: hypothetical protein VMN81_04000 [Vicinamibacterales bacterium]|nr:hypothetical protein [Vicinamibacterales bacterium]